MSWKIFISVLAMSDTGSVSTSVATSDFPSQVQCAEAATDFSRETRGETNGHKFVIRVSAECRLVNQLGGSAGVPPEIPGILNGFFSMIERSRARE